MDLRENTEAVISELRSVISFYDDLTPQEKEAAIQYSIETKCPHELFLKLYNLGTSISNLRGKRADLHSKFKEKSDKELVLQKSEYTKFEEETYELLKKKYPSNSEAWIKTEILRKYQLFLIKKRINEKENLKTNIKSIDPFGGSIVKTVVSITDTKPEPIVTISDPVPVQEDVAPAGKPLNSYQQFVKEMRAVVKAELPDLPNGEVLKEIGRRWKLKTGSGGGGDDDPTSMETPKEKSKEPKKEKEQVKEGRPKKERSSKNNIRETTPPPASPPTQLPPPASPVPATPDEKGKTRKQPIPKYIKSLVWKTYIGESSIEGVCQACKLTTIYNTSFQCGHVVAEANGGDQIISNLRPICADCNSAMGTTSMTEYVKRFFGRDL